jgi:TonB family protein
MQPAIPIFRLAALLRLFFVISTVTAIYTEANAGCYDSASFSPSTNDTVDIDLFSDDGSCIHPYQSRGLLTNQARGALRLTSSSIVSEPKNGTLSRLGDLGFKYQARADFTGVDQYTLQVCGEWLSAKGCSILHYRIGIPDPAVVLNWKLAIAAHLRTHTDAAIAREFGSEGSATLWVVIDRKGVVHRAGIERSSGTPLLDKESLKAIYAAQPFPSPPSGFIGDRFRFVVPISLPSG